ncbi:dynamin family protein [Yoonia sediminilitoris]|uniref:Dynamin family protein n=1 Tax=Yoonia sediminilitoris TaxID=1286148 RepID=A0A2T6KMW3_9RHOB|nr:dynamin family protein [Yoonia sediminilitoris]PUB17559.1 dynamin family protein [Yoonia sediminilitoris]RCW97854.1 dynamin family protein [Yoonia sediminilitoris]
MKMEELTKGDGYKVPAAHHPFMRLGLEKLDQFHDEIADLEATLADVVRLGGQEAEKKSTKLIKQLRTFEPSVTMIGQIKSGKTSLVNAMIGRPALLPADVNPWTSVVTSLHLNAPLPPDSPTASFQFFSQGEWDHLVENGGRIGELSARAGADEELEKVREQIAAMREKTKARLGRKFELLLGQKHNYAELTDELVERYVCMGDDFEDMEDEDQQGQFADITKSADVYLTAPSIPMPLCLRDTPGVNDTFMMREQITINALRDSRICVVVLSAHQALSSMDMGLIRLIANVKSREVIIFVNRIDELSNPAEQVPEIRESILKTLADHNGPEDPELIFGSAYWANIALSEDLNDIVAESAEAMFNWAEVALDAGTAGMQTNELVWHLSGVPALYAALAERVVEGPGAEVLAASRKRARNLVGGVRASNSMVSMRMDGDQVEVMPADQLMAHLDKLEADNTKFLNDRLDIVFQRFGSRVDQSHKRFLDRALESLLQHLETNGEDQIWQYSPDGLRMLLRTSYQVMRRDVASTCDQVFASAAADLAETYRSAFGVSVENFSITPPAAPEIPAPVSLGQTIALDLQTSWWKGWWKRRKGYRAFASGFYDLIEAETSPIVDELKIRQAEGIRKMAEAELREFLAEQRSTLSDISAKSTLGASDLKDIFGITAQQEREELFDYIYDELSDGAPEKAGEVT